MNRYYVRTHAQDNGDHEVHMGTCSFLPQPENRIYLGLFPSCYGAVVAARALYPRSNGCFYCSNACHTS